MTQLDFLDIFTNRMLLAAVFGWLIAQILKVIIVLIQQKRFDIGRMIGSGGMPSSHSAFVTALATCVGMTEGFGSTAFAICVVISFVVMYDASGVRRETGRQAEIINELLENIGHEDMQVTGKRLKELVGHSPFEVFAGAVLGILIGLLVYWI